MNVRVPDKLVPAVESPVRAAAAAAPTPVIKAPTTAAQLATATAERVAPRTLVSMVVRAGLMLASLTRGFDRTKVAFSAPQRASNYQAEP
jgi:hypothetical protein